MAGRSRTIFSSARDSPHFGERTAENLGDPALVQIPFGGDLVVKLALPETGVEKKLLAGRAAVAHDIDHIEQLFRLDGVIEGGEVQADRLERQIRVVLVEVTKRTARLGGCDGSAVIQPVLESQSEAVGHLLIGRVAAESLSSVVPDDFRPLDKENRIATEKAAFADSVEDGAANARPGQTRERASPEAKP